MAVSEGKHMPGGFGRAMHMAPPSKAEEKKPTAESDSKEVTIKKHHGKFAVHSKEGHMSEHPNFHDAVQAAAQHLDEVAEPESAQDEAPTENALGMVPGDNDAS